MEIQQAIQSLSRMRQGKTKRVSSYDRTGGNKTTTPFILERKKKFAELMERVLLHIFG
jgi:hypothetical protein